MTRVPNTHCYPLLGLSTRGKFRFKDVLEEFLSRDIHKAVCDSKPALESQAMSNLAHFFILEFGRTFWARDAPDPRYRVEPAPTLPHDNDTITKWVKQLVVNKTIARAESRTEKGVTGKQTKQKIIVSPLSPLSPASLRRAYNDDGGDDDDDDDEPLLEDHKPFKTAHKDAAAATSAPSDQAVVVPEKGESSSQHSGKAAPYPIIILDDDDVASTDKRTQVEVEIEDRPELSLGDLPSGEEQVTDTGANRRHPTKGKGRHPDTLTLPTNILTDYKINKTRLLIETPASETASCVRLRDCMTNASLFETATRVWGLEQGAFDINSISVAFHWARSPLRIRRGNEEEHRFMLEGIDVWPGWQQEKGLVYFLSILIDLHDKGEGV
ncbi:MAG: hypothetical protein M1812_005681 [Candelaria pacifica]|nr:MAG: hypothetical protein M1812_005681 [Candelaria pacifica]